MTRVLSSASVCVFSEVSACAALIDKLSMTMSHYWKRALSSLQGLGICVVSLLSRVISISHGQGATVQRFDLAYIVKKAIH